MKIHTAKAISMIFIIGMIVFPLLSDAQTPPIITFFADPSPVLPGEVVTLSWFAENAFECMLLGRAEFPSGLKAVTPEQTTDYTISCRGHEGIATKTIIVTVTGTNSVSSNNSNTTNSNTTAPSFAAACVASPSSPRTGDTVSFTGASAGSQGALRYVWSGDVTGEGQRVFAVFTSGGTKTARLSVTDGRGIAATNSCSVFIEQRALAPIPSSIQNKGTSESPLSPTKESPQKDAKQEGKGDELAAASAQGGIGLLTVFIISIIIAMGILFYFFIYAKKKRDKETEAFKEQERMKQIATQ